MANYAIGDIQGCHDAFMCLLDTIEFNPENDTLWLAGDLVNRGPDSLGTLKKIHQLASQGACHTVLGNHDLHMLAVHHNCSSRRPKDNFHDVLNDPDAEKLLQWLQSQSLALEIKVDKKTYLLTHAGVPPNWSRSQTLRYAQEVESFLQSDKYIEFFQNMYGNDPDIWQESLEGIDRLKVITNYLTRMRFCNAKGQLELLSKSTPEDAPEGFRPWFTFDNPLLEDTYLLFGHWAALQGKTGSRKHFALDTGCVWGNKLSALRLEDARWFSCDCE